MIKQLHKSTEELHFHQSWEVDIVNIRGVTIYKNKSKNLRQITGKGQSILASIKPIGANGLWCRKKKNKIKNK